MHSYLDEVEKGFNQSTSNCLCSVGGILDGSVGGILDGSVGGILDGRESDESEFLSTAIIVAA